LALLAIGSSIICYFEKIGWLRRWLEGLYCRYVPAKKSKKDPALLTGDALLKEACRRLRVARDLWKARRNAACRGEREKALALYERLTPQQKDKVPQTLRVWLRYRSEKYFGDHRTRPGTKPGQARPSGPAKPSGTNGPRKPPKPSGNAGGKRHRGKS